MRHEMRGARRILAYCDKAMGAICLDRHILRLACVQFGGRTQTMGRWRSRERPLLYLATNQPGSRREWIRGRSVILSDNERARRVLRARGWQEDASTAGLPLPRDGCMRRSSTRSCALAGAAPRALG